ncbi:PDC sensor domain-containing protein [Cupriavidus basilensis]
MPTVRLSREGASRADYHGIRRRTWYRHRAGFRSIMRTTTCAPRVQDQQDFHRQARPRTSSTPRWKTASPCYPMWAPQLAGELGRPGAELRRLLERRIPFRAPSIRFMVADAQGRILAHDGVPVNVGDRDYFREAARTLEPVITPPIRARVNGATGVLVAVPIVSPQGEFVGLLGGWLDLSSANFLVEITHNRLGTTGFYCLVSAGRMPVYVRHPDPGMTAQPARALGDTCGVYDRSSAIEFLSPSRPLISPLPGWEEHGMGAGGGAARARGLRPAACHAGALPRAGLAGAGGGGATDLADPAAPAGAAHAPAPGGTRQRPRPCRLRTVAGTAER